MLAAGTTKQLRPPDLHIVPRPMDGEYLSLMRRRRFWHGEGPVVTHFINALQGVFPEGERFFIEAARDGVGRLERRGLLDGGLLEDFRLFLRQESRHAREHAKWNRALVRAGYARIAIYDAQMQGLRHWLRRHLRAETRLAITAAAEHYTATLAYILVYASPELLTRMPPPYQNLFLYHAMEEVEHKAVCYDLFQLLSGSYLRRLFGFAFITLDLWINVFLRNRYLLRVDGLWGRGHRRRFREFYFGPHGLFRKLRPRLRAYLRFSFHPWNSDERGPFERTFGVLRAQLDIPPFRR